MDKLAENIKILREEKGISQSQLAERLFVTRQAVARWENGNTRPDIETIGKLAEIFDVSVEYLITGKELVKEVVVEKEVVKEVPVEKIVEKKIIEEVPPDDYDEFKMFHQIRIWGFIILTIIYTVACLIATIVVLIKDAKLMAKLWVIWVFAIILFVCDVITIRKYIAPDFLKRKNKDKRNKK